MVNGSGSGWSYASKMLDDDLMPLRKDFIRSLTPFAPVEKILPYTENFFLILKNSSVDTKLLSFASTFCNDYFVAMKLFLLV